MPENQGKLQDEFDLQDDDYDASDPGLHEGEKKTDPSDKLKEDHPRFKQVYGKMKNLERELESRGKEFEVQKAAIEQMKKHNEELSKSLETEVKKWQDKDKSEVNLIDVKSTENEIKTLQGELEKAYDEEDYKKAMRLTNEINDLRTQILRDTIKPPDLNKLVKDITDSVVKTVSKTADKSEANTTFKAWLKNNEWYGKNPKARRYADAVGADLAEKGDKTYEQILDAAGKEAMEVFKLKPKGKSTISMVEGSTEVPDLESDDLTTEEKETAKLFGMKESEYLAQKKLIGGGGKR